MIDDGGAAAAAAAANERMRQEEEEMTGYTSNDLAEGWEFKILRSQFGAFRKPERLRAILEEERRGGWVLVEKFDDQRIRLKRPARTKVVAGDLADGYDPYRSHVGLSSETVAYFVLGGAVLVSLTLMLSYALLAR
jgi:hypothetical protein